MEKEQKKYDESEARQMLDLYLDGKVEADGRRAKKEAILLLDQLEACATQLGFSKLRDRADSLWLGINERKEQAMVSATANGQVFAARPNAGMAGAEFAKLRFNRSTGELEGPRDARDPEAPPRSALAEVVAAVLRAMDKQ